MLCCRLVATARPEAVHVLQEHSRTRQAQLAGRAAIEQSRICPFRPNAAPELETIEALLSQDDSWLSD